MVCIGIHTVKNGEYLKSLFGITAMTKSKYLIWYNCNDQKQVNEQDCHFSVMHPWSKTSKTILNPEKHSKCPILGSYLYYM